MSEETNEEIKPTQGKVHKLKDGLDVKRLIITYPSFKVLADIYKPKSFKGSLLADKTSDIEYDSEPFKKDLEVIVTNLEHYGQSDVVFESFEQDKTLLKILTKEEDIKLPSGTKVIVKDNNGNNYKTYLVDETEALRGVLGKNHAVQYELTPIYLANQTDDMLLTAKKIRDSIDSGSITEDDGSVKDLSQDEVILDKKEYTEDGVLKIDKKGELFYE